MKSRTNSHADAPGLPDSQQIDALYGLEPVFEPGAEGNACAPSGDTQLHSVQCPYCGEVFQTMVDPSAGSTTYVEDCQVCCQPIELELLIDEADRSVTLNARREG